MYDTASYSTFLPILGVATLFNLASINLGYSWVYVVLPHCGLVNVPSMTDDVKYLFMYIAHFCTWVEC